MYILKLTKSNEISIIVCVPLFIFGKYAYPGLQVTLSLQQYPPDLSLGQSGSLLSQRPTKARRRLALHHAHTASAAAAQ